MMTSRRRYRRGALLSLLNLFLSPLAIGILCFGILLGVLSGLSYLFPYYHRLTVPAWINPIGDIEWTYAVFLVPLFAAAVAFPAAVILLCGYLMSGTMLRQWGLTAFYAVFYVLCYLAVMLLGQMGPAVQPLDFRVNFAELSLVSSAAIWSFIWGSVWRRLMPAGIPETQPVSA